MASGRPLSPTTERTTMTTTTLTAGACPVCKCRKLGCACHSANGLKHTRALDPTACHVCDRPEAEHAHPSGDGRRGHGQITGHTYYSIGDAYAEAAEHDRRVMAAGGPVYSNGARNAEAAYVIDTRGE